MLGVNIETDMREKLFNHVQKLSFRFFDNTKTGHIMSRISNDLFDIGELAHHGPEDMFIALMTIAGTFTYHGECERNARHDHDARHPGYWSGSFLIVTCECNGPGGGCMKKSPISTPG